MLRTVVSAALTASVKILWLEAIGSFVTTLFLPCAMYAKVFSSHHSFFTVVYFVVSLLSFKEQSRLFLRLTLLCPPPSFFFFFCSLKYWVKWSRMQDWTKSAKYGYGYFKVNVNDTKINIMVSSKIGKYQHLLWKELVNLRCISPWDAVWYWLSQTKQQYASISV